MTAVVPLNILELDGFELFAHKLYFCKKNFIIPLIDSLKRKKKGMRFKKIFKTAFLHSRPFSIFIECLIGQLFFFLCYKVKNPIYKATINKLAEFCWGFCFFFFFLYRDIFRLLLDVQKTDGI